MQECHDIRQFVKNARNIVCNMPPRICLFTLDAAYNKHMAKIKCKKDILGY